MLNSHWQRRLLRLLVGTRHCPAFALLMSYAARLPRPPVFWVSSPMREDVNELRRNRDLSRTDRPSATDEDITAARASGISEDQIFEMVVCAAIGQASRQYDTALEALEAATKEGRDASSDSG